MSKFVVFAGNGLDLEPLELAFPKLGLLKSSFLVSKRALCQTFRIEATRWRGVRPMLCLKSDSIRACDH